MNQKKENLLKHYETWLWYSRGDCQCKKALRKEMLLDGILVVPTYLLILSVLAFLLKFIVHGNFISILQTLIMFFFLPCMPGCICAFIYPIYKKYIIVIGYIICFLIAIFNHFMDLDYSILLSLIISIVVCEKMEAQYRRSKEIEIEILINKLKSEK